MDDDHVSDIDPDRDFDYVDSDFGARDVMNEVISDECDRDEYFDSYADNLIDQGWWDTDQVNQVKECANNIYNHDLYTSFSKMVENRKEAGISSDAIVDFLMRLNMLMICIGLEVPDQLVKYTNAYFNK